MAENILLNYALLKDYVETSLNTVGATESLTLRNVPAPSGDIAYVRKFGVSWLVTQITDIGDPVNVNMTFTVKSLSGTTLGSRVGGGAFVAGSTLTTAEGCYLEISASGGAVTVLAGIDITGVRAVTGAETLTFVCAAETVSDGDTLTLYLSDTTSTYYDSDYMYGGARHSGILNDNRLPYKTITLGLASAATANDDGVEVVDSAIYDEDITLNLSSLSLYASLGQTPTITRGVGARITREVEHDGNNLDTRYVSKTGLDTNSGTYQEPFLTVQYAENNMGGLAYLNIMDSEIYAENIVVSVGITIEPIYNKIPIISAPVSTYAIEITNVAVDIYGLKIDGNDSTFHLIYANVASYTGTIKDNEIYNSSISSFAISTGLVDFQGSVDSNRIYNCGTGFDLLMNSGVNLFSCVNNIIYNSINSGISIKSLVVAYPIGIISNNILYDNNASGIFTNASGIDSMDLTIENNTIYNNSVDGIRFNITNGVQSIRNNIIWGSGNYDLNDAGGDTPTITYSNYETNNGFVVGAGNITTDPEFCKDSFSYKLGISANSGAYRTDFNSDDMGAHFRIIEIDEDRIVVNGFNIDGQSQYNNAIYILDSANHTTTCIDWCSVYDFQGIAIDPYDDDTTPNTIINNCKIYNNGNGVKFSYGGNTVNNCLIYNNSVFGIWADYTSHIFNHCVFYNNRYGLYIESSSGGISIKNSIFHYNGLYGIYSESFISPAYCDITDSVNANVNTSDATNLNANPLFFNLNEGEEDFHLKSTFQGFQVNSLCIGGADDGGDIGVYIVTRSIDEYSWSKYLFEFNPQVNWTNNAKGYIRYENANGSEDNYAKSHRRRFEFDFGKFNQVSSEELRQKMEYFGTLIKTRENGLTDEQTIFRLHFQPDSYLTTGTAAIISGTQISDAGKTWTENQFKGFHVGIKWASGTNMVIDSVAKTGTISGVSWTIDQWIGYYMYLNGYYYFIKSNTAGGQLVFSDPFETLVSGNAIWNIEKYFKILSNSQNALSVYDPDSELSDGNYDYYVDFIEVKCHVRRFNYNQNRFLYSREFSKTGYKLIFEEAEWR